MDPRDTKQTQTFAEIQATEPDLQIDKFLRLLRKYQLKDRQLDDRLDLTVTLKITLVEEFPIRTPDALIQRLKEIYGNLSIRFCQRHWNSAFTSVRQHSDESLENFCFPIARFILEHSYLPSEIYKLIKSQFPWDSWFESSEWRVWTQTDEQDARFVYNIIGRGNFEQDLLIETIPAEPFDSPNYDRLLGTILHSTGLCRNQQEQQALQVLSTIPMDVRPAVAWQRMAQILYDAAIQSGREEAESLFLQVVAEAMELFPDDEDFPYLKNAFLLETLPAFASKEKIIKALKEHPEHETQLFLLAKCYLQLDLFEQAYSVLKYLCDDQPVNLKYYSYLTRALNGVLSRPVEVTQKPAYLERMLLQLQLDIYDLVEAPEPLKSDPDIKALKHYADSASRRHLQDGSEPTPYPQDVKAAMEMAKDDKVRIFLFWQYQLTFLTVTDLQEIHDLILDYFEEFPDAFEAVYAAAGLYYGQDRYEQAYELYDRARQLNPQYAYTYQGMARSALHLGEHEKCIAASRVFQHAKKYDREGYYCMGKSYFDNNEYQKAYACFHWMVQLEGGKPSPHDQYIFMLSLRDFLREQEEADRLDYLEAVDDALQVFDSFPKGKEFKENTDGIWSLVYAGEICEIVGHIEKGLEYINPVIDFFYNRNIIAHKAQAALKTRLLVQLHRYGEAFEFLKGHLNDLQNGKDFEQEIAFFEPILKQIEEKRKNASELNRKLHDLINKSANSPAEWRHVYQQLMLKARMEKDYPVMLAAGTHYFEFYNVPDEDDVFMAFWLADAFTHTGSPQEAKVHWKRCLEAGKSFSQKYPNLITMAGMKLNA